MFTRTHKTLISFSLLILSVSSIMTIMRVDKIELIQATQAEMAQTKSWYKEIKQQVKTILQDDYETVKAQLKNACVIALSSEDIKNDINKIVDDILNHKKTDAQERDDFQNKFYAIIDKHLDQKFINDATNLLAFAMYQTKVITHAGQLLIEKLENEFLNPDGSCLE